MKNFFEEPQSYREIILKSKLLQFKKKKITGKSLACIFLTKFCSVGCPFCFFKSPPAHKHASISDQFDDYGIDKFLNFAQEANLGYILVSGGGEPMNRKRELLKIIENVKSDRIVLVTSGSWARNYSVALKYLYDIKNALSKRVNPINIVVRVSVSKYHALKLGIDAAANIVDIFNKHFMQDESIILQIKAFENDSTIDELLEKIKGTIDKASLKLYESDNVILEKKVPKKLTITLASGYKFFIGISKVFDSSVCPDLNNDSSLCSAKVFEEDLKYCEDYNSTIVYNKNGSEGLDWSISYNGNICTWQNQSKDNYCNLYRNTYSQIMEAYYDDPLTYSLIEKGNSYRYQLISEVDEISVMRSKVMGMRDATGLILFEDEKTRLYYTIRVIQDFISEGRINIENIPINIRSIFSMPKQQLIKLYNDSSFNISTQQIRKLFHEIDWKDFLYLVRMGHYNLSGIKVDKLLSYYNNLASIKVLSLESVDAKHGNYTERFLARLN